MIRFFIALHTSEHMAGSQTALKHWTFPCLHVQNSHSVTFHKSPW